jgi:hypothetical protein
VQGGRNTLPESLSLILQTHVLAAQSVFVEDEIKGDDEKEQ